jgi:hypothetical protein
MKIALEDFESNYVNNIKMDAELVKLNTQLQLKDLSEEQKTSIKK